MVSESHRMSGCIFQAPKKLGDLPHWHGQQQTLTTTGLIEWLPWQVIFFFFFCEQRNCLEVFYSHPSKRLRLCKHLLDNNDWWPPGALMMYRSCWEVSETCLLCSCFLRLVHKPQVILETSACSKGFVLLIREARPILAVLVGPSQESLEKQSRQGLDWCGHKSRSAGSPQRSHSSKAGNGCSSRASRGSMALLGTFILAECCCFQTFGLQNCKGVPYQVWEFPL